LSSVCKVSIPFLALHPPQKNHFLRVLILKPYLASGLFREKLSKGTEEINSSKHRVSRKQGGVWNLKGP
jgi:hypothetical protein